MTTTTADQFNPPSLLDSMLLLAVVFGAAAAVATGHAREPLVPWTAAGGEVAALRVKASPQQGFGPLHLNVEVRQQFQQVAGRQVCLRVVGPEDSVSCWADEWPATLVIRNFELRTPGDYEVFAVVTNRSGQVTQESNHLAVHVVSNNQ